MRGNSGCVVERIYPEVKKVKSMHLVMETDLMVVQKGALGSSYILECSLWEERMNN